MKDTIIKIKSNLQGINSRVDEANNQINDLEHKEAKNQKTKHTHTPKKPIRTLRRKKSPKK